MGVYLLYAAGLIGPFFMIRYREAIGDMVGDPKWTHVLGGIYAVVVYLAIIIFFWTVAEMTGSTSTLFFFLTYVLGITPQTKDF
jgi:hypothetical protein